MNYDPLRPATPVTTRYDRLRPATSGYEWLQVHPPPPPAYPSIRVSLSRSRSLRITGPEASWPRRVPMNKFEVSTSIRQEATSAEPAGIGEGEPARRKRMVQAQGHSLPGVLWGVTYLVTNHPNPRGYTDYDRRRPATSGYERLRAATSGYKRPWHLPRPLSLTSSMLVMTKPLCKCVSRSFT